ncbi:DEAD/DEAH box helicase [Nocardiopsis coralliicola]
MELAGEAAPRMSRRDVAAERAAGRKLLDAAAAAAEAHRQAADAVRAAAEPLAEAAVAGQLAGMPVARLRDATGGRLRLGDLEEAGYATVGAVRGASHYELTAIPGIGDRTARQVVAAAETIAGHARAATAIRLDPEQRDDASTAIATAVHRLVAAGPEASTAAAEAAESAAELRALVADAAPAAGLIRGLFSGPKRRARAREAADRLRTANAAALAAGAELRYHQAAADLLRPPAHAIEAWEDFTARAGAYYAVLGEVTGAGPERAAAEGFLPDDIAEQVRDQPLDTSKLRVTLRGYQAFGARFALARRRVLIGDEMGLGKTVQAIAAMAHLAADGATHFLVICPASVLVNWLREIEQHSALAAVRLHGPEFAAARDHWRTRGGVAVTTFNGLTRLAGDLPPAERPSVGLLTVDEAHYVKNPEAQRSRSVADWAGPASGAGTEQPVLFLSGTPMENRVGEFRSLVQRLDPALADSLDGTEGLGGPTAFRRAVARLYLRRNQEDVLDELPEMRRIDEWEDPDPAELAAYRRAVSAADWHGMRRSAYAAPASSAPASSAKLERLRELVDEAAGNGRKVLVFSYYRDVLATVAGALADRRGRPAPGPPITGSVPPARRQAIVDAFTAAPGHAVLLAQIEAGGTGLNLQAASVVILCEPQVKPTWEEQAAARAHRMGQTRSVQVHRLLSSSGVDGRMVEILGRKQRAFDSYARRSDLADAAPAAVDLSDDALARTIVAEEQRRLAA